ncbi:MAG: ATP-binding protein [Desulfobacteraceae bacterium]
MQVSNPFTLKVIASPESFCNRTREQKDLVSYARSGTNLVLYSPRRYGKTSLIRLVQKRLKDDHGFLTSYTDFFAITSIEDIAQRIARSIYKMLEPNQGLFKKSLKFLQTFRPSFQPTADGSGFNFTVQQVSTGLLGIDLLEKTMEDLGMFLEATKVPVQITFDEFQEITELKAPEIEGVLRKHIQEHRASYFFVGSRRRVLLNIFVQQKRPFYQSALTYQLKKLPREEFKIFLRDKFFQAGRECPQAIIDSILDISSCHPYYTQKLAFFIFQSFHEDHRINDDDFQKAFRDFLEAESMIFESMLQGLSPRQIAFLKALSREPSSSVLSSKYMQKHGLKSIGGVQSAIKRLEALDFIEKDDNQVWCVVDPVFGRWFKAR